MTNREMIALGFELDEDREVWKRGKLCVSVDAAKEARPDELSAIL